MTDRADWLARRREGIGASDVAGVLGRSRWSSPWSIWAEKTGLADADDPTPAMRFGLDLEPIVARYFTEETGLHVAGEQTFCQNPEAPFAFATVDGFVLESPTSAVEDALGVLELKVTGDQPWEQVPEQYVLQCNWQMFVTGFERVWLAALHLAFGRPRLEVYTVERDDALLDEIVPAVEEFWTAHVLTGTPPPPDASPATTRAITDAYPPPGTALEAVDVEAYAAVIAELRDYKDERKRLDDVIAQAENDLRAALGEHTEGHIMGRLVVSWRTQHRKEYVVPAKSMRVLRLHGGE